MNFRDIFATVLAEYPQAKTTPLKKHPLAAKIRKKWPTEIGAWVDENWPGKNLMVTGTRFVGSWAYVPWLAVMDQRLTNTTQHGLYVVISFAEDGSRVSIGLGQGVTSSTQKILGDNLKKIHATLDLPEGFKPGPLPSGSLGESNSARGYEPAIVAYKLYEKQSLPENAQLEGDIRQCIDHLISLVDLDEIRAIYSDDTTSRMPSVGDNAQGQKVWILAPGQGAKLWDEWKSEGIGALGWDGTDDLSLYSSREEILPVLFGKANPTNDALALWSFSNVVTPGDLVFAKRGTTEIIGWGVFESEYRFEQERSTYRHVRDVDWRGSGSWTLPKGSKVALKTLTEITDYPDLIDSLKNLVGAGAVGGGLTDLEGVNEDAEKYASQYSLNDFVRETGLTAAVASSWLGRLKRKKQIVLQGPPGTGKTYVAQRLARLLLSETHGFVDLVQFHPSYAYEDFMQGIRPKSNAGNLPFSLEAGRFIQFCENAKRRNGAPCVLIIDEINRANLSRVFGELMYLLEYRNEEIPLAAGGKTFKIPENVFLIGTMNTADRSIALIDHAFRRRFSFIFLGPEYSVLASFLDGVGLPSTGLVNALKKVNTAINDRNYEVGISFFLADGGRLKNTIQEIWQGEIEPYLEEYFYGQENKVEPLRWTSLAKAELEDWSR